MTHPADPKNDDDGDYETVVDLTMKILDVIAVARSLVLQATRHA